MHKMTLLSYIIIKICGAYNTKYKYSTTELGLIEQIACDIFRYI